jgi:molecular chaperone Hsp33
VSTLVRQGLSPEEMAQRIAGELQPRMAGMQPLSFSCHCSRERVIRAIVGLGREALNAMARGSEDTEVRCDFCSRRYYFSPEEIRDIIDGPKWEAR